NESPAFQRMKAEGKTSKAPLTESFGQWRNLKVVVLALVGLTMGQAVVWYTGQFYTQFFLTGSLQVDGPTATILGALSLLIGPARATASCAAAEQVRAASSVGHETRDGTGPAKVSIGDKVIDSDTAVGLPADQAKAKDADFKKAIATELKNHGYPTKADPEKMNKPLIVLLLTILVIYVTMVYGPIAAMLVEMFPTRIRYTSMSLPYHIGNGWLGC